MLRNVGIRALAVSVPDRVITNEHWRRTQSRLVEEAEKRSWLWTRPRAWTAETSEDFTQEMAPFLGDPFRGSIERRFLADGQTALELEADAARRALDAAGIGIDDIDLLLVTSFQPDHHGIGGAVYLARELGSSGAAWNIESACSSANLGLMTACNLVRAGQFRRALVVTSCTYSRVTDESDPLSWTIGDAATALVVGEEEEGCGYLGGHSIHSADTCGAVEYFLDLDADGEPRQRMRTGRNAGKLLRETSVPHLRQCVDGALAHAGLERGDIDFGVFNTPLAWYASFCARALGLDRAKTINMHPIYNNVGPCLTFTNLFHAGHWQLKEGDRVLIYSVGSVSSCTATLVRWGKVALAPLPEGTHLEDYRRIMRSYPRPVGDVGGVDGTAIDGTEAEKAKVGKTEAAVGV